MKILLIVTALLLLPLSVFSNETNNLQWNKEIDWEKKNITITVKSMLDLKNATLAANRNRSEQLITESIPQIFLQAMLDFRVSSLHSAEDVFVAEPEIFHKLISLAENRKNEFSILSKNLTYLENTYIFPIYPDLVEIFYDGTTADTPEPLLTQYKTGRYSGLIIYVPEKLPLYKKSREGSLEPALFPRIFDEDMNLIVDKNTIIPHRIKKSGLVQYTRDFNEDPYLERVGLSPLRTIAIGIFGTNNTDIIISREAADKIRGNEENIKTISQGRILIIF